MASWPLAPRAHAIIRPDKVVARVDGVVAVRLALDQLAVDKGAPVAAPVVGAQRVGEGPRRGREEGRGEGSGGSFREQSDAGLEAEGQPGELVVVFLVLMCRWFCVR